MALTTSQTTAQVTVVLVSAGALQDQAVSSLHSLAWSPVNKPAILWGVLVKCTTGWNSGDPKFSYDASPS